MTDMNKIDKTIYVFGHKNPDTDSIISAIVYAEYLNKNGQSAQAIKIGAINKETEFLLNKLGLPKPHRVNKLPANSKVFLVDHNEKDQSIDNLNELEIIGIIDHHKFGNFSTNKPIFARLETLGCTNSIFYKIFKEKEYEISPQTAKLMLSAIISDTLFFRSPTTTPEDKKIVEKLNKIAQIQDLEERSIEMFNAKSDVSEMDTKELIMLDFKEYEMNKKRIGFGVIETTNTSNIISRKEEIIKTLTKIKNEEELDFVFLSIIDILEENNITLIISKEEEEIIKTVFGSDTIDQISNLGSRISRKKQLAPLLDEYFTKN